MKKLVSLLVFSLALILTLSACTPDATPAPASSPTPLSKVKVSLALDYFPNATHTGLYIAQERGYFAQEGLEVEIQLAGDPTTNLQTVAAGRNDFGIDYQPNLLIARAEGVPVVSIMALVQHPLNSVIALKDSGIAEPKDWVGKKVGRPGLPIDQPMLSTMLKSQGKSLDDVELVDVGFNLVPALISKEVDAVFGAYWTNDSIVAETQGFPVNIMRLEQYGVPDYYELVLISNEEKIAKDPDEVQRFVRAVSRGYQDAIANPQDSIQLLKQVKPEVDLAVVSPGVELLAPVWAPDDGVFGWQEESRWVSFTQWMLDNGLLSKSVDAKAAFNNSFVDNASKE